MKSKSKSEIARAAGISTEVLRRWMMEHRNVISAMGGQAYAQVAPSEGGALYVSQVGG